MTPYDETFWLGQSIVRALCQVGWVRGRIPPPPPAPVVQKAPPRYQCTLMGVSYDRRNNILKAVLNDTRSGRKRSIYLGNAAPTWEHEQQLHAMWRAAKAAHMAGGDTQAIKAAALAACSREELRR